MKTSRYILVALVVLVALMVSSCATPTPEVVEVEKVVEQTVVVEKEVEKEVEKIVEQTVVVVEEVEKQVEVEKVVVATPTAMPEVEVDQYGGSLVAAQDQDPFQLDPLKDPGSTGNTVILTSGIVESLIGRGPDGEMVPELAVEMPEVSDDGLTFTFKLREGVKFHDGTDLNADAVKFNWVNMMDPDYGTEWSRFNQLYSEDSIEVIDDHTISITFTRPYGDFLWEMMAYPTWNVNSPTAVQEMGSDYGGVNGVVGTGPYKWGEWIPGDRIILVKNEDYWDEGLPYLDEIVYKTITDPSVKLINLQAGEADLIFSLPFQFIDAMDADPDVNVAIHGSGINEFIFLNNGNEKLKDPTVRKALSLAIDRQTINDLLFQGIGDIPNGPFPPWHWASPESVPPMEYNPEEAKALLEAAGYSPSNPLQIELRATNQALFLDQAALVQSMWAEVGVEAEILPLDKAAFFDPILISGTERDAEAWGKFEAGLEDFGGGSPMIASYYETHYMPYAGENATCYNEDGCYGNPDVVRLIEESQVTVDPEELKVIFEEMTLLLREDVPYIRIMWLPNVNAVQSRVQAYETLSQNSFPLKYVWVEE